MASGLGGYTATADFQLDPSTGLWCGKLPPCQSREVTVEITDELGSTPVTKSITVVLQCPVPTLNQWGLILFGLLLAAAGAWYIIRMRKRA